MSSSDSRLILSSVQETFKFKVGTNREWSAPADDYALLLLTQVKKKRKHTTQESLAIEGEPALLAIENWKCPDDHRDDHGRAVPNQRCPDNPHDFHEKAASNQERARGQEEGRRVTIGLLLPQAFLSQQLHSMQPWRFKCLRDWHPST